MSTTSARCEHWDLPVTECAHCRGDVLDVPADDRPAWYAGSARPGKRISLDTVLPTPTSATTDPEPTLDPVVRVARDLREIRHLAAMLADQALHKADASLMPGGEAQAALGPVANLEASRHQWATLVRRALDDTSVPFPEDSDEGSETPLQVLASWSQGWRVDLDVDLPTRATYDSETTWLADQLTWAAEQERHFDDFVTDVHQVRLRLEAELYAGIRTDTGAPCLQCGRPLERRTDDPKPCARCEVNSPGHRPHDRGGVQDGWWYCANPRCPVHSIPDEDYRRNVAADHLMYAAALTAADLERRFGVKPATVRKWAQRGVVRKAGKHADGRMQYAVDDVRRQLAEPDRIEA